jgi:CheY-like chemotaxis protein
VGDAERIQQVVWNLLSNAIKFTPAGGSVHVSVERAETTLSLSVTDTGAGLDPEFLPFLFERFKQADSTTTRRFGGLGLGLALVRHIAELHGGSVLATSAGHNLGSTFKVTLPFLPVTASVQRTSTQTPSLPVASSHAALMGLRVLVVEDDNDARELVTAIIVEAGGEVQGVSSAAAAFEALRSFRPQILVSDIGMPDEDGYSLIRRIRELNDDGACVPSIAMTAYTRAEDRTKALAAGFTTFIGKPINPTDLVAAVLNLSTSTGH